MSQRIYSFINLSWVTERTENGFVWNDDWRAIHEEHYQQDLTLPLPPEIPEGRLPTREIVEPIAAEIGAKVILVHGYQDALDLDGWKVEINFPTEDTVLMLYDVPPRFAFNLARRLSRDCGPFFLIEVDHGYGEPTVVVPHSIPEGYWTQDDGWEDLPELL